MHKLIFKFSSIETESDFFLLNINIELLRRNALYKSSLKFGVYPMTLPASSCKISCLNIDKVYAYFKIKCHMRGNPINLAAGGRRETSRERDAT